VSDSISFWQRPRVRFYAVIAAILITALVIFVAASSVLLPFQLAFLIAYVINPVINGISRRRVAGWLVPRWAAVLLVYVVLGLLLWVSAVTIVPQIYGEVVRGLAELRDVLAGLGPDDARAWARRIQGYLDRFGLPVEVVPGGLGTRPHVTVDLVAVLADMLAGAAVWARTQLGDVLGLSRALLTGVIRGIFFVVLLLMITAFISMDAPRILGWIERTVPRAWRRDYVRLVDLIDRGLAGVVRGQLTVCLLNGVFTLVGLLVLQIPFPFALAALATVLYVLPIFGTIIATTPVVLLALIGGGPSKAVLALVMILAIHGLEAYVLNPKIVGDASKIHPVLIVLALVIGEHYFGLVGALLAFPTASLVASVFKFMLLKAAELEARAEASAPPPAPPAPMPRSTPPPPRPPAPGA
jgi:predicted PurR-regulated permease PerM